MTEFISWFLTVSIIAIAIIVLSLPFNWFSIVMIIAFVINVVLFLFRLLFLSKADKT